jgi:hypothetical protein
MNRPVTVDIINSWYSIKISMFKQQEAGRMWAIKRAKVPPKTAARFYMQDMISWLKYIELYCVHFRYHHCLPFRLFYNVTCCGPGTGPGPWRGTCSLPVYKGFRPSSCNGSVNKRTVRCAGAAKSIRLSSLIYRNLKLKKEEEKRAFDSLIYRKRARAGP